MSRSIVTRHGDAGQTKLILGEQVSKADLQVEAYGTIDELNSFLGLARSLCDAPDISEVLEHLQRDTFIVGAELATPVEILASPDSNGNPRKRVGPAMVQVLDSHVARCEETPGLLDDWALPGATRAGAAIDVARSVARRAERCVVRLAHEGMVPNPEVLKYMNRVSDLLWLLGRRYEIEKGADGALR